MDRLVLVVSGPYKDDAGVVSSELFRMLVNATDSVIERVVVATDDPAAFNADIARYRTRRTCGPLFDPLPIAGEARRLAFLEMANA